VKFYKDDLQEDFIQEFQMYGNYENFTSAKHMYQYMVENRLLLSAYPNVAIALQIYLSLFSTSCEAERSFSTLKRIKNYLRATMGRDRLSALARLSIDQE
jgi:hypothetical protein